jgi:hypothetical protein
MGVVLAEETPTYTIEDAYELAQMVIGDISYQFTSTRDKAIRLYLAANMGAVESYNVRSSTTDYTDTIMISADMSPVWAHLEDDLSNNPSDHSEAIKSVERSSDGGQNWQNADYSWQVLTPLTGYPNALTIQDPAAYRYKISYWYDDVLFYQDLIETIEYYARVFLNQYTDGNYNLDTSEGNYQDTAYAQTTNIEYSTDTSNMDIDENYSSGGNVFANTLQDYYLLYCGVSIL